MRKRIPDALIIALLFALPLVMFWQQTVGGRTLLPTENLFQFEPFATYREVAGAPAVPHNALVSDLVLENYQWKSFIRQSLAQGEIPLWNPHQFAGIPFLAAGQPSTLYPFNILYYVLPLPAAYGWFTVAQLWLAGAFMYAFLRGLHVSHFGALVGGVVFQLSGFFLISAVFPMIIGAAAWLPLVLLMTEYVIRQQPALRGRSATVPWVAIGAVALGCNVLAGHVEITYYTLIILAYYAAVRLVVEVWRVSPPLTPPHSDREGKILSPPTSSQISPHPLTPSPLHREGETPSPLTPLPHGEGRTTRLRWAVGRGVWLAVMVALGLGLGAVQFIPLFELVSHNWRSGSASFQQVLGWAHPWRDLLQFAMPNFYGNPSHHTYFDVFTGQTVAATVNAQGNAINTIDWGIKNYVEGALYLGILPLTLAVYALADAWLGWRKRGGLEAEVRAVHEPPLQNAPPYRAIFAVLAAFALTFMFGLPTYGLLFFTLPGIDQLHSPFRWIFAVTLCVAALAGFGADALGKVRGRVWARRIGYALVAISVLTLVGLLLSRVFYAQIEPLVERAFTALEKAPEAFADARMFYSYEFGNVLVFGLMALGAGVVMLWANSPPLAPPHSNREGNGLTPDSLSINREGRKWWMLRPRLWQAAAVGLIAVDLMVASWGFNPASDPALLDFTPPAIEWLMGQEGEWRYTTLDDPAQPPLMRANIGWRYGLDDIRGYESIIPKQYVDYMQNIAPQVQLEFNRVAPIYTAYPEGYEFDYHEVFPCDLDHWNERAEALNLLNVRYIITHKTTDVECLSLVYEDEAVRIWEGDYYMPRSYIALNNYDPNAIRRPSAYEGASIIQDTGRELLVNLSLDQQSGWLVVNESYFPGWRAYIRPQGSSEQAEHPLEIRLVNRNFIGAYIIGEGDWTVRLVYSPASFQVGAFTSFISAVLVLFMVGVWLWRLAVTPQGVEGTTAARVMRNSLAPILLNLFNRGIDFAFAAVMLRVLGPEDAGLYQYAIVIFVWFDIFTNFGLNTFLTREVARDRSRAGHLFFNTSIMRLVLMVVGVLPLAAFLAARQALVTPPLSGESLLALGLLYIGLLPSSLSTGMTALFYAFEKAEYPAAVTTIATVNKAVFGLAALVLGWGIVGLAGVSIVTNLMTLAVLVHGRRELVQSFPLTPSPRGEPHPPAPSPYNREGEKEKEIVAQPIAGVQLSRGYRLDWVLMRGMARESWPLMLNHFLATIFFQIDVVLLEALQGAEVVGRYSTAYKWLLAINVIPAFFTMALLPVMSRQAQEDRAALQRTYTLAIKLLVSLALPLAALFTFTAYFLTLVLGGLEYLPDGAIALQLMIWSIPIGWMNSLTQYVLIALDLQRRITYAFVIGVAFNLAANLVFIPQYGYRAAALITIASELALWLPFALLLHRAAGRIPWLELVWRPALATGAMLVVVLAGWQVQPVAALVLGCGVYVGLLWLLRPLSADELERLRPLLPGRWRRPRHATEPL